ncbi:carbohydrate kinase [Mucilaginibacter gynuensis]|uniref:Carbohydrate kinase n=1 Tax=Mucilaginibacter gynuensis TaxID=1302236 RepID=A0ABP8GA16_9SPHI
MNTVFCYGEMLWDMLPDGPQPGGAPLNVAYHLSKMGIAAGIISRVGADDNGTSLIELATQWGLNADFIQTDDLKDTSKAVAKMNGTEVTYDILQNVAWDFIETNAAIKKEVKAAPYLIYGSLASRNEVSRDSLFELLSIGNTNVFDVNLRAPHYTRDILEKLLTAADIVKFNQDELGIVYGFYFNEDADESAKVAFIMSEFAIAEVLVTKGAHGASYYNAGGAWHVSSFQISVADTIGSGDSFLAAFIANHSKGENPGTTLRKAMAMGCFIATKKGGCPDYNLNDYQLFLNQ